jgi:hypothetical protein
LFLENVYNGVAERSSPPAEPRPANILRRAAFSWRAPAAARVRAAAYVAATLLCVLVAAPQTFVVDAPMADDGHAARSLDLAFTRAQCGGGYAAHPSFSPARYLLAHPEARVAPLSDIVAAQMTSVASYCADARPAAINNENSLLLVEWAAIRSRPRVSLAGIGERLHLIRIGLLAFAAFAMIAAGTGVAVAVVTLVSALALLKVLEGSVYSVYPFLFVLLAFVAGLYSVAVTLDSFRRPAVRLGLALLVGLVSGFAVNIRTSHLPVYAGILLVGSAAGEYLAAGRPRVIRRTAAAVLAGLIGYAVFQFGVLALLLAGSAREGSAAHPFAHPLVLSLALPPNAVSAREGIRWEDQAGLDIARKTDPGVRYLAPEYGSALRRYYVHLWREYPREMAQLYVAKLKLAGTDIVDQLSAPDTGLGRSARYLLAPLTVAARNGIFLMMFYGVLFVATAIVLLRTRTPAAVPVLLLTTAAILLQVEAIVIMPYFVMAYHNFSAFYALFASALLFQLLAVAAIAGVRRAGRRDGARAHVQPAIDRAGIVGRRVVRAMWLSGSSSGIAGKAIAFAALLAVAAATRADLFVIDQPPNADGHALASLELALSRAMCGAPSAFSPSIRIPYDVRDDPALKIVSMRTLLARKAGSIDAYCASVTQPFVNNENSLMLVDSWILWLRPNISIAGLGRALHALRIAGLIAFGLVMLRLGAGVALTFATTLVSLFVLHVMQEHVHSAYPFLFVLILVAVALYGCALEFRWTDRRIGRVLAAAAAGALSAFAVNMRTSYLPVYAAMLALFVCADLLRARLAPPLGRGALLRAGTIIACFAAGYVAFQVVFITSRLPPAQRTFAASHSIAHPLVLALGVPPNDLSRREGIEWRDAAGAEIALRMSPDARYLGPKYDEVLLRYYVGLWKRQPGEMLGVYVLKFKIAGQQMIGMLRGSSGLTGRLTRILLTPLGWLPNGLWLLAVYVACAAGAAAVFVRRRSVAAFALALLAASAVLLQIESGVIMPFYVPNYHNYLAFFSVFLMLLLAQAMVDAAWRFVEARRTVAHA